ncbi:hypothetical protein E8E11_002574 [Didymella keratinophila]|nr:hypothetical protein E8E11_002574 [Didymella keratinophila]
MTTTKRCAAESCEHEPKRPNRADSMSAYECNSGRVGGEGDSTAVDACESPLLRLPAELRISIWTYAFGDKMVVVDKTLIDEENYALCFVVYNAVYEEEHPPTTVSFPALLQLVSRRFWAETSEVFPSTCTFRFNCEFNFRRFALSNLPIVPRVRRIMVYARPCWSSGWWNHFGSHVPYDPDGITCMYYMVGNLKILEGVKFIAELSWLFDEAVREPDLSVDQ